MKVTIKLLATGFGLGYMPFAPGTWGSLLGIALAYWLSCFSAPLFLLTLAAFTALSIWISSKAERIFREKDSSKIVIDEVCGMALTLFLVPLSFSSILYGFLLFRIFDILKPFPIRKLEKSLPNGYGIVLDDVMAGVYACATLHFILHFF